MDGVRPVATAAREQRRETKKVLGDIDALLWSCVGDDDDVDSGDHNEQRRSGGKASIGFGRKVTRNPKRFQATPGPGSYAVESAADCVKPRVVAASFRLGVCSCRFQPCSCASTKSRRSDVTDADGEATSATIDAQDGLGANIKGAVQYQARVVPNYRSYEQKQKVRVVMAAKHRWKRVGFHSVSHRLVERRVDVGLVAFNVEKGGEKLAQARIRRKVRAWTLVEPPKQPPTQQKDTNPTKSKFAGHRTTQWMQARANRLLRESERRKNAEPAPSDDARSMARSLRELPAHEMKRQNGRESVRYRSKHLKVVLHFCDDVLKEPSRSGTDNKREVTS